MKTERKKASKPKAIRAEDIASVAEKAAKLSYGVISLAPRTTLADVAKELIAHEESFAEGIYLTHHKDGDEIDVYLRVAYGVKIPEVLAQTQKRIAYELERAFGVGFKAINVYAVSVKEA